MQLPVMLFLVLWDQAELIVHCCQLLMTSWCDVAAPSAGLLLSQVWLVLELCTGGTLKDAVSMGEVKVSSRLETVRFYHPAEYGSMGSVAGAANVLGCGAADSKQVPRSSRNQLPTPKCTVACCWVAGKLQHYVLKHWYIS